jgi:hypothetical protein
MLAATSGEEPVRSLKMERAFRGVAREGALGITATLGAANLAQLVGASTLATWHLWMLRWDDLQRAPILAWRELGVALIALAGMPALACGAAACLWAVRRPGRAGRQARRRISAAWVWSVALAAAAWLLLRHAAMELQPYPPEQALMGMAATLALGVLPAWWFGQEAWRRAKFSFG